MTHADRSLYVHRMVRQDNYLRDYIRSHNRVQENYTKGVMFGIWLASTIDKPMIQWGMALRDAAYNRVLSPMV